MKTVFHFSYNRLKATSFIGADEIAADDEIIKPFSQVDGRFCTDTKGNYPTFEEAKIACWNYTSCWGVYNKQCDMRRGFQICIATSEEKVSMVGSCIHRRVGKLTKSLNV